MSEQKTLQGKSIINSTEEEIEPWDLADRYYEEWRDEQAISGKWDSDKIELEA